MYDLINPLSPRLESETMDRQEYLQRYSRLAQESNILRQRLSTNSGHADVYSPVESLSPEESPVRRRRYSLSPTSSQPQAYSFPSASGWPIPQAVPAAWKSPESEQVDEASLYEINHQIKVLLTDLLNCDAVRSDKMSRAWVQARLMDAEHELKRQRRRRSSVAQETVRSISLSLGTEFMPGCRASY